MASEIEAVQTTEEYSMPSPAGVAECTAPSLSTGETIASLMVQEGYVTKEQLRYAKRIRSKLRSPKTVIGVLEELHFIRTEDVRETLRSQKVEIPLGALLVELGYLRESDLRMALSLHMEKPGFKLGRILVENHFLAEEDLVEVLSFQLGFENLTPTRFPPDPEFLRLAPISWFRSRDCIPLERRDGKVLMAFADPMDKVQIEAARSLSTNSSRYCRHVVGSGSGNPLADTLPPTSRHEGRPNSACRERNLRPGGSSGTNRTAAPTPVQPELVYGPTERIHRSSCKQRG